ncbi:hypothetical protein, partial [Klebsiella pneumoniae]
VGALDRALHLADLPASIVLVGAGFAVYAALCWLFDIARLRGRLKQGLIMFRTKLANSNVG